MVQLPPPPRFVLPPPPMQLFDVFDTKLLAQLTCSSIRQQQHHLLTNPRLILISSLIFLFIAVLLTVLVIIVQVYRQRKSSSLTSLKSMPPRIISSNDISLSSSRSYETISSKHTGLYLESIDTSATTYSTDPSNIVCIHCQQDREHSTALSRPYYHTLDILPT
jgi:hypothetical protein